MNLYDRIATTEYTPELAHVTRFYTLLVVLKATYRCPAKDRIIRQTMKLVKKNMYIRESYLYSQFTRHQIRSAWQHAKKVMIRCYDKENTRGSKEGELTCSICMENKGDFICAHEDTAHGGICGSCALTIILSKKQRCPMCSQQLDSVCKRPADGQSKFRIFDC